MSAPANIGKAAAPKVQQQARVPQGPTALNPERLPALSGKFAKMLGKDYEKLVITYSPEGVSCVVQVKDGEEGLKSLNFAEFFAAKKKANEPDAEEKYRLFRNKYELRLNKEFPRGEFNKLTSEGDSKIQEFLETLNFRERRALVMSQKEFAKEYPNGYTQA